MLKSVEDLSLSFGEIYLLVYAGEVVVVWEGRGKPPEEKSLSLNVFLFLAGVKFLCRGCSA